MRLIMIQISWLFAVVVLIYVCVAVDALVRRVRMSPASAVGGAAQGGMPPRFISSDTALVVPACLYSETPSMEDMFTVSQGRAGQHMLIMIKAPVRGKVYIDIINADGRTIAGQKRPAIPGRAQYFSCDGSRFARGEYLARVRFTPEALTRAGGTVERLEHFDIL
jgi:hypothetical protein